LNGEKVAFILHDLFMISALTITNTNYQ